MPDDPRDGALTGILAALRRRWLVFLLCVVLVPAAALAYSLSQEKEYSASALLLFNTNDPGQELLTQSGPASAEDRKRNLATSVTLIALRPVAERVAEGLERERSPDALLDAVSVETGEDTDTARVTVSDSDPERASEAANLFAQEFIASRREAARASVSEAQGVVEREFAGLSPAQRRGNRGTELRQRIQDLELLGALETGNAELVGPARTPGEADSPRPRRDALLGALLGLALAGALALLVDRLDRRIRDPRELDATLALPVLGLIPTSRGVRAGGWVSTGPLAEAFRLLRVNLRYLSANRPARSLLVTSPGDGEGKTLVASQLAFTAAASGTSVLLVEADMRRPTMMRALALEPGPGLADLLVGLAALSDVSRPVIVDADVGARHVVDVVPAGQDLPPNPGDLLESERMVAFLEEAEDSYELVVIDAPPTLTVSDAVPLLPRVGGTIVVVRLGVTTREAAAQLRDQLEQLEAPVLGMVVNGAESEGQAYTQKPLSRRERRAVARRAAARRARDQDGDGAPRLTEDEVAETVDGGEPAQRS